MATDITIEILREIRDEIRDGRDDRQAMRSDMAGLREEVGGLREEMNLRIDNLARLTKRGFEQLAGRLDNVLLGAHGEEHRELRHRVERLEAEVGIAEHS